MKNNGTEKSRLIFKIVLVVIILAVVIVGIIGAVQGIKDSIKEKNDEQKTSQPTTQSVSLSGTSKTFNYDEMEITLTEDFEEFEDSAITAGYVADGIEIYIIEDTFEDFPEYAEYNVKEYAEHLAEANGEDASKIQVTDDGLYYYNYIYDGSGEIDDYNVFFYKSNDGFWMVHFITSYRDSKYFQPYVFEWARSVTFD